MALAGTAVRPQALDRQSFRAAMSKFATGVAVLTTSHDGERFGMTINSLTSVSLNPFQILVCVNDGSPTGKAIKSSGRFAVSLLGRDQQDVAGCFVGRDAARFDAVHCPAHEEAGVPLVDGALVHLVCEVNDIVVSGDHEIVIGDVVDVAQCEGEPLVFFGGAYGSFAAKARERAA